MLKLKTFKKTEPGLIDLLRYSNLVSSGIVTTKDGSLLGGFWLRPQDTASSTDELQALISSRANDAMLLLGTGWSMWGDVVSVEAADYPEPHESFFPDPISRAVDEERRRNFRAEGEHFDNERMLFLCYTPPIRQVSKLDELVYSDDGGEKVGIFAKLVSQFERALAQFEDRMGGVVNMRRMQSYKVRDLTGREHLQDELVNAINYTITGQSDPLMIPAAACYLDTILGARDFYTGERPFIGGEYLCTVSIDGFPVEHLPNIMARLNTLAMPYRFSQRAIFLDPEDAIKELKTYKRKWGQKTKGFVAALAGSKDGTNNEHAVAMRDEAEAAISLAQSGTVLFLYYSGVVVLRHRNAGVLEDMARAVSRAVKDCGFDARIEDTNTVETWLGSLPGENVANVRRPLIHSQNFADFMPLAGVWTGLDHNPCPFYPAGSPPLMHAATVGCIPYRLNVHVGDVPHVIILGPIGKGKSTLTSMIALQGLRYPDMRIWCLDNKRGMYATVKACGGNHYEVGGDGTPSFCPLGVLDNEFDLAWAQDWLETCFKLQTGKALSPAQRGLVRNALVKLAHSTTRSVSEFTLEVQDAEVREALEFYTLKGPGGHLLDAKTDNIQLSHFNVFETQELMNLDDKMRLPVLLYLFQRFEQSLDGRPALLFISEAWVALGNPVWRDRLHKWLKLLRSKNCGVIMDTQSLSDAYRSGILDVLIESCPTKIYLPNEEALKRGTDKTPGPLDLYQAMQLNENQIEIIRSARGKREYYVTSPEGSRLIDLDLGPMALAIAGATSEDDAKQVRKLVKLHGDDWIWHWLDAKGVNHAALL